MYQNLAKFFSTYSNFYIARLENTMIMLQVTEPFQNFSLAIGRVFSLLKRSQNLKYVIYQRQGASCLATNDHGSEHPSQDKPEEPVFFWKFLQNGTRDFMHWMLKTAVLKQKKWHYLIARIREMDTSTEALWILHSWFYSFTHRKCIIYQIPSLNQEHKRLIDLNEHD